MLVIGLFILIGIALSGMLNTHKPFTIIVTIICLISASNIFNAEHANTMFGGALLIIALFFGVLSFM